MTKRKVATVVGLIVAGLCLDAWAKCPTSSVTVNGHLRCSLKADYKVLVTLIFARNQPEASAEETAFDIRDDSFQGRVAFDTFTSYNPLTGHHHCNRRPMSLLLRLVTADGVEQDRKTLRFPDDFIYDEQHGEYAVRSDVILHGWCEPKCSEGTSSPCPDSH